MKRGEYFESLAWLNPYHVLYRTGEGLLIRPGLICKVTRSTDQGFYCRAHYGWHDDGSEWLGSLMYFRNDYADKYVGTKVQPPSKVTP